MWRSVWQPFSYWNSAVAGSPLSSEERVVSLLSAQLYLRCSVALCVFVLVILRRSWGSIWPPRVPHRPRKPCPLVAYLYPHYALSFSLVLVSLPQAWEGQFKVTRNSTFAAGYPGGSQGGLATSAGLLSLSHGAYNDWAMGPTAPYQSLLAIKQLSRR